MHFGIISAMNSRNYIILNYFDVNNAGILVPLMSVRTIVLRQLCNDKLLMSFNFVSEARLDRIKFELNVNQRNFPYVHF